MTLRDTGRLVGQAREIVFSRRELLKMAVVAAGAATVAACGGGNAGQAAIGSFAVETWRVQFQKPSPRSGSSRSSSAPPPPEDGMITVNDDSTFTSSDFTNEALLPSTGIWGYRDGTVRVTSTLEYQGRSYPREGLSTGAPDTMSNTTFSWNYKDAGSTETYSVPATWDGDSKALTLIGTLRGSDQQFPITITKQ